MTGAAETRIGLVVRAAPYARRAPRADLDVALAAAALDFGVDVFFLGEALLQLAARRDTAAAQLPPGLRGWSALPDLGCARLFAERDWLKRCEREGIELSAPVTALPADEMRRAWARCSQVLVL